jgi:hypothetical protein
VLGYTQAAFGLGGLMVTGAYYVAVTYAERFPAPTQPQLHIPHTRR